MFQRFGRRICVYMGSEQVPEVQKGTFSNGTAPNTMLTIPTFKRTPCVHTGLFVLLLCETELWGIRTHLNVSSDGDDSLLAVGVRIGDGDVGLAVVANLSDALTARPNDGPGQLAGNGYLNSRDNG